MAKRYNYSYLVFYTCNEGTGIQGLEIDNTIEKCLNNKEGIIKLYNRMKEIAKKNNGFKITNIVITNYKLLHRLRR